MNKVIIMGRLTKEPVIRYAQGDTPMCIASYIVAVDRRIKKDGQQTADFIPVKVFGKGGEFAEKYLHKGTKIVVTGRIQTGSYEKDGRTVYTTDVIAEDQEFAESKATAQQNVEQPKAAEEFIPVSNDEELPF